MKTLLAGVVLVLTVSLQVETQGEVNGIEDLDIQKLFSSDERVKAAYACLMDQAPCGKMQALRDSIPQLVETSCANCTPRQKLKYDQVIKVLSDRYPDQFKALALKYSPKND